MIQKSESVSIKSAIGGMRWEPVHEPKEDGEESGREFIYTVREVEIGDYRFNSDFCRVMVVVNPNGQPKMVFMPQDNYSVTRRAACNMVAVLNNGFIDGTAENN